MTLSGTANTMVFTTVNAVLDHSCTFEILGEDEIVVALDDVVLTFTTDYTVAIAGNRQFVLSLVANPGSGHKLVVSRKTTKTQATDYVEGDPFPSASHELALDRLTMAIQDSEAGRAFRSFTANDATPSVSHAYGSRFKTANTAATTITMFDSGTPGQIIIVIINDAFTTIDFTGGHLIGNGGVDWAPTDGDWLEAVFDGADWYCAVHDCTA